jgi:P-loop containing NTP hydrolase pore-1/C-terminal domain on Strawberry notch homologue
MNHINAAIAKYSHLVALSGGYEAIRLDAKILLHEDIGQGYKTLKNRRGEPCDKSKGWHGLRGACIRKKRSEVADNDGDNEGNAAKAELRKSIAKTSAVNLAAKIKAERLKPAPDDKEIKTARPELMPEVDLDRVPLKHRKNLSEEQQVGVAMALKAMDAEGGFLLADGTGVGKTRQILAIADEYARQGKKVLIISKAEVLKPDWKKGEASGSFSHDGKLMGVGTKLIRDGADMEGGKVHLSTYQNLAKLKDAIDGDTVILYDEAHAMKNSDTTQGKTGIEMSSKAGKVLFASATPADKPTQLAYLERSGVFGKNKKEDVEKWMGVRGCRGKDCPKNAEEVHARLNGIFDQMTEKGLMVKREISMQGVKVKFDTVKIPPKAYEEQAAIAKRFANGKGVDKAQMLMSQRRQLESHKVPAAVSAIQEELKRGRQVVLFAARVNESGVDGADGDRIQSDGTAKALRKALLAAGLTEDDISEIHGGTNQKAGDAMGNFQSGKARVVIATVEAGGTGINLDDTDGDKPRTLIMMTPPFSAVDNVQAAGRVWRKSTKSMPEIRYLTTDTEVDKWNNAIIADKMSALSATVEGEIGVLSPDGGKNMANTNSPRPPADLSAVRNASIDKALSKVAA